MSVLERAVRAFVHPLPDGAWVALSGGADSLALTAAAARTGVAIGALIVDHGLQPGSGDVAERAAQQAQQFGLRTRVLRVSVGTGGGREAAARVARYEALDGARDGLPVLIAHTLDDQAETVLLGLARGSGARSIAGMRPWRDPWGRPLLGVRRELTARACAELGLAPHHDPHNSDRAFTRVRLRAEVLPLLEEVLGGGVAPALARTARELRADNDLLDELAREHAVTGERVGVTVVRSLPAPVRTRVLRDWLHRLGTTPTEPVIRAVDDLLVDWHGQGAVAIGGDRDVRRVVARVDDRLVIERHRR
nr:tRNA lysidine(34) synthetase TilS [Williamsia sterculiae]